MIQQSGHFSAESLRLYRQQLLSPQEFVSAQDHLRRCEECRARLGEAVGAQDAFISLRAELTPVPPEELEHLSYDQLAAYVDQHLDEVEREISESHMAICAECEADARDLRRYRASAEEAPASEPAIVKKTLWQRLFPFNFNPASGMLFPAGAAAALAIVLLLVAWLALRRPERTDGPLQARVEKVQEQVQESGGQPALQPSETPVSGKSGETQTGKSGVNKSSDAQIPKNSDASPSISRGREIPLSGRERLAANQPRPAASTDAFALKDGDGRVTLDSEGQLHGLESLLPAVQQTVKASLQAQHVMRPSGLDNLAGGNRVLMGGAADAESGLPFTLVGPIGTIVRGDRPKLCWRPLKGATAYTVAVVGSGFKVIARSEKLTATEWMLPASLPRGAMYYWQVTALTDGAEIVSPVSPAPLAKFRVLDQKSIDELESVEKSAPDSHLVRGVMYARAGLIEEAEREFEILMKANPRSTVARRLLQSVRER